MPLGWLSAKLTRGIYSIYRKSEYRGAYFKTGFPRLSTARLSSRYGGARDDKLVSQILSPRRRRQRN